MMNHELTLEADKVAEENQAQYGQT